VNLKKKRGGEREGRGFKEALIGLLRTRSGKDTNEGWEKKRKKEQRNCPELTTGGGERKGKKRGKAHGPEKF